MPSGRKVSRDLSLMTRHEARVTRHLPASRAPWVAALKAVLVVLPLGRPQVLALVPKALPPGVVPWGSGPGQPTFSVTRRCVSRRNASPPRLHAASCFPRAHGGLHCSSEQGLPGPGGSTRHQARVTRHLPASRAPRVAALKAVPVVLPLGLPQVLALVPRLFHLAWFLGVQALASPASR